MTELSTPFNNADFTPLEHQAAVEKKRQQIFKSMTAERKWEIAADLYYSALHLKQSHLKRIHPEWDEEKVSKKAREWMLYARS